MVMTREDITAWFVRRQEAFKRHDARALAADHADECILQSPMAGQVVGREAIEHVYRAWFTGFPDVTLDDEELIVEGDRIVEVAMMSGTDTGGFMGLPPTGKGFRASVVLVYAVQDGQIVRFRTIYDFTGILVQTGLLRAKPV